MVTLAKEQILGISQLMNKRDTWIKHLPMSLKNAKKVFEFDQKLFLLIADFVDFINKNVSQEPGKNVKTITEEAQEEYQKKGAETVEVKFQLKLDGADEALNKNTTVAAIEPLMFNGLLK